MSARSSVTRRKTRIGRPVCFIVGAGPGIGAALAEAFVGEGFDIVLLSRGPLKLRNLCQELSRKTGHYVAAYAADAGDPASLKRGLDIARADFGDPQVLIYNAAAANLRAPGEIEPDVLVDEFRTNVGGALVAVQEVAPAMVKAKKGTILFTGSGVAYEPAMKYASLSLGKAALRSLAYTLAQELGTHGVHVGTVTIHGFVQRGTRLDPQRIAQTFLWLHRQPKGHFDIEKIHK
ncbi:SDR family NAD(P)-dependent oxidoreductase [Solimonas marina]|uniref:SDR family NAD(P)-dependent oxidoreductase n=1 Tax=Solimonas marina TaxID=2714601 RepID=A0A969WAZ9_9GAMM|nr:SDR family NAD(P)-dependent oxidoreductase [Solimonas marina]NKF24071.1 SDR family NAD(P)-dependent oxidoreductase [Solimonas marina]